MALAAILFCGLQMSAQTSQSRTAIRNSIEAHGKCKNVVLTNTKGNLMLYDKYGCVRNGLPKSLDKLLSQLIKEKRNIKDVVVSESGQWLVLYGDNGCKWSSGIPTGLKNKIREYNRNKERISTAVFNDNGDYIIVSDKHFAASDNDLTTYLKEGTDVYGPLWTVCLTNDGFIAVYENGYRFNGNIDDNLRQALRETNIDVYRLKMCGPYWFFANEDGSRYKYNL